MKKTLGFGIAAVVAGLTGAAQAQESWRPSYTLYGTPGLIEMPTAQSERDAEITATIGYMPEQLRNTISFQISPRLSGSFRYSRNGDYMPDGHELDPLYDRSFDLRYRLVDESNYVPAIAIGLQDFIGTGVYSGEYIVATKTVSPRLRVTGGIGWGRFGSYNGFDNPLGDSRADRPGFDGEEGGDLDFDQYFSGDAAFFGGLEYRLNDNFRLKAEYSSDGYVRETRNGDYEHQSPVNLGLTWVPNDSYQVGLAYMNGHTLGLSGTILMNPTQRGSGGGFGPAPVPVAARSGDARAAATWDQAAQPQSTLQSVLAQTLAAEGIELNGLEMSDRVARVRYTNDRYRSEAQAMGRVSRIMTHVMPASVETFVLEPMQRGLPLSAATIQRSDLEALENTPGAAEAMLERARFGAAGPRDGLVAQPAADAPFQWGITPYTELSLFDGNAPLRGEIGLEFSARYQFSPNLVASGMMRQSIYSDFDDAGSISPSSLPPVRRNAVQYAVDGDPGIDHLTLAWYGRAAPDVYTRVTAGYLESMYGGVSAEVLWKPVDSRLALGVEINHVMQRDFDMLFGFQEYETTTGHVSAYYEMGGGWHGQLDVGRYLAEDYGATVSLDREFSNGWRVGGYFTVTDVSAEEFGEGSFDKGIRLTVPFDWALGNPTRRETSVTLSSLSRDGGARVNVDGRLYETLRDGHLGDLSNEWGRFWK